MTLGTFKIQFYFMVLGLCCELCYIKGENDTIARLITLDFLIIIVLHRINAKSESLILLLFLALRYSEYLGTTIKPTQTLLS